MVVTYDFVLFLFIYFFKREKLFIYEWVLFFDSNSWYMLTLTPHYHIKPRRILPFIMDYMVYFSPLILF
jgi:hypothetical protein